MPTFEIETTIEAPLDRVWELHTSGTGLQQLTPSFFNLRIEEVRGTADPDGSLPEGAEIDVAVHPFEIGDPDRWTSVVETAELTDEHGCFVDEMRDGRFPRWVHTHRFQRVFDDETLMRDHVEYRLPTLAGDLVGPAAVLGLEPLFQYRHWRAKRLLE